MRASLKPAERLPTRLRGSERADLRLPRFGVRYTLRSIWLGGGVDPRLELVYRPSQRFTIRPRFSRGWHDSVTVDYVLGVNTDFHFRPGRTWRPSFVG